MPEGSDRRMVDVEGISKLRRELAEDAEFRPVWENRRKVIFVTLSICGSLIALIVIVPLLGSFHGDYEMRQPEADILSAALYVLALTAVAVIGSYVFGSAFDSNGYRSALNELAKTLASR